MHAHGAHGERAREGGGGQPCACFLGWTGPFAVVMVVVLVLIACTTAAPPPRHVAKSCQMVMRIACQMTSRRATSDMRRWGVTDPAADSCNSGCLSEVRCTWLPTSAPPLHHVVVWHAWGRPPAGLSHASCRAACCTRHHTCSRKPAAPHSSLGCRPRGLCLHRALRRRWLPGAP